MQNRSRLSILAGLVSALVLVGVFFFYAEAELNPPPPPPPSWVSPLSGVGDESLMPPLIPVSDAQGNLAGYVSRDAVSGAEPDGASYPVYANVDGSGGINGCFTDDFDPHTC